MTLKDLEEKLFHIVDKYGITHDCDFDLSKELIVDVKDLLNSGAQYQISREIREQTRREYNRIYYETLNDDRRISSDAKKQDLSIVENIDNPFYNKKIVISGVFENFPIRNNLALLLKKYGADINGSISKETDIFIAGSDWGPKKMEKFLNLKSEGYKIELMNELGLILELTKLQ